MTSLVSIALNFGLAVVALSAAALAPKQGALVAIVVPPFAEAGAAARVATLAGGELMAPGRADWIVVARSDDPNFIWKAYGAGALAVVDAAGAARCGS
ncbi:hypothetical protein [Chenggangzhangella methanolivorans]|uniref:Uncharacterized protein n=1 Tax=Chenggangzhangella methanolivorans TaxID=1437009 RepID=A0A9E6R6W3_9HYPH|nr:hypothetical protein [Chenggangzhangella methanolivorans]QZN99335.1 hypothetical protein K6K41_21525 [Chenggangzhangella methanolivorans]